MQKIISKDGSRLLHEVAMPVDSSTTSKDDSIEAFLTSSKPIDYSKPYRKLIRNSICCIFISPLVITVSIFFTKFNIPEKIKIYSIFFLSLIIIVSSGLLLTAIISLAYNLLALRTQKPIAK